MILQILCLNLRPQLLVGTGWRSSTGPGRKSFPSGLELSHLVSLMIKGQIGDDAGAKPVESKEAAEKQGTAPYIDRKSIIR